MVDLKGQYETLKSEIDEAIERALKLVEEQEARSAALKFTAPASRKPAAHNPHQFIKKRVTKSSSLMEERNRLAMAAAKILR